jgi:TolB-like protein/DNA-binding winged helix-turn-helix (wHTH) protein/Flp pilus assembly protein TadD
MSETQTEKRIRFGPFELDSASCELRKNSIRLKITGQPLQILGMLVERSGAMVTREELRERLWAADTFVDFEHSLNTAIKRLRRVLDDDPEHPRYVETVPRHGYRFIGVIETEPGDQQDVQRPGFRVDGSPEFSPPVTSAEPARSRKRTWVWIALLIVLSALLGSLSLRFLRPAPPRTTSVAVFPFVNASGDDNLDYLGDGLADNIIDQLSQLRGFDVVAWSLASRYRSKDPASAGKELGVGAVLTGSVTKDGNDVVVRSELLDPVTRRHLWGQEYTRNLADLRSLQFEITSDIARRLGLQLTDGEKQRLDKQRADNPEAYELYLKGRYYSAKGTKEGLAKGLECLQQATEKDPNYALAYSGLAYYYFVAMDWLLPPREANEKSRAAAEKALSLDDSLAEAHTMLGIVHWTYDWNWVAAENEFRRAIELNPSYAPAHQFYGLYLASLGRSDEAISESRRALALDPLSSELNGFLGQVLERTRHTAAAIRQQQKTVELDPNNWFSHLGLGFAYLQGKQYPDAIAELNLAVRLENNPDALGALGLAYGLSGDRSHAEAILLALQRRSAKSYVPPYDFAQLYIGLGDRDKAFQWLERARQDRGFAVAWLNVATDVDSLRADPRFKELLRPIGFPKF